MNRFSYDRKVTAMMVEDFLIDPILGAKVLLNLTLPPHQEIRLMQMWVKSMYIDDSGFSTGKSITIAAVCALRSCLIEERDSLIVSGTFRQSKLVFRYFDKWKDTSPLFRSCLLREKGQYKITHGQDAWECKWKGNSTARALPPGFTQDSERLRSERANDGYFDEWTTFPVNILTKTLFGRITKANKYVSCPVRQNHKALLSTPQTKADKCYSVVESTDKEIDSGSSDHGHFTCNWRHIPMQRKWAGMVDYKAINDMQKNNSKADCISEIEGFWADVSLTYYDENKIELCRTDSIEKLLTFKKRKDSIVSFGFDTARGGGKQTSNKGDRDDFSLTIAVGSNLNQIIKHTFSIVKNSITSAQCAAIIRKLFNIFNPDVIAYDPHGGGVFVIDELEKATILDNENKMISVTPIVDMDDHIHTEGIKILVPFSRGHAKHNELYKKSKSDSIPLNKLHSKMTSLIENRDIIFCPPWDGWDKFLKRKTSNSMRKLVLSNPHMDQKELIHATMDLCVSQIMDVDIARDKDGEPLKDSYSMYKFTSKGKKDIAYGLLYSIYGIQIIKMLRSKVDETSDRSAGSSVSSRRY